MKEATKAMNRRSKEKSFPWNKIFSGHGVDVGCGDDLIATVPWPNIKSVKGFDSEEGNANFLDCYFEPNSLNFIHGSQVLEHLDNPGDAIKRMLKICKKKGHIIMTVPDVGAYEDFKFPSKYNPDHKSSWSMIYRGSSFPIHIHIPTFLDSLSVVAETILARYVEVNYNWKDRETDQTMPLKDGVEIWNEFVLRKK